jgi:parallel beta-helix repeat protein
MKKLYIIFIVILLPSLSFGQTDLFVATNGSDFNDGSLESPFRNIQKACNVATPGSTVFIKAGVYFENLIMNVSGLNNSFITFKAFEDGEVIVDGDYKKAILLEINNHNYIKIQNINFRNANGNGSIGIILIGSSSNISIQFCEISNISFTNDINELAADSSNSYPFVVYGTDSVNAINNLIFNNNKIKDCRPGYSNCVELSGNVNNFKLNKNTISQNENSGIAILGRKGICSSSALDQARNGEVTANKCFQNSSPYENASGICLDGCKEIVVEKNTCYKNQYGITVTSENQNFVTVQNTIRDNIIYLNLLSGIMVGNELSEIDVSTVRYCNFTNNTIFRNDQNLTGIGEINVSNIKNCSFLNNITFSTGQCIMLTGVLNENFNNIFDYNCWFNLSNQETAIFKLNNVLFNTLSEYKNSTSLETNSLFENPNFVNTSNSSLDFHPQLGSSLIDGGSPNFVLNSDTDYEGNARIIGDRIDIGCYEYYVATSTKEFENNNIKISIWPNPSDDLINFKISDGFVSEVKFFDITGKLVKHSFTKSADLGSITIKDLQTGIYFISLQSGKNIYSSKFIKN